MKVYITKGLPASGKTSWALDKVKSFGFKRVNKDDLRKMLDGNVWSNKNEKFILQVRDQIIELALHNGETIIVDDTNLHPKHIASVEELAKKYNAVLEIMDFTDVPLEECIHWDQTRPNYVGEKVIRRMHNQFLAKKPPIVPTTLNRTLEDAWVCDLDGTLAIHDGRSPYDYPSLLGDVVNEPVRIILNSIRLPRNIFIVSGRPDTFRALTEQWLKMNEIEYTSLFMRKAEDKRNDSIVKREIYEEHIKGKYHVMGWFDDRQRVCREVYNLGLPLFRVGDPDSDF
jgi:predicted kinase